MRNSKFKIAIVDDEEDARSMVCLMLEEYFPELDIVCETGIFREALVEISRQKPHILLLDVEMPEGSGFDLLEKLAVQPATVFITAHDKYAIQAIRSAAQDYILKPLNSHEFKEVMERLICRLVLNESPDQHAQKVRTFI